jgi:hypothetical protein
MRFLPARCYRVNLLGLLVVAMVMGTASCEDKHIGRACQLSVGTDTGGASGTTSTIDVGLECPSRICILPSREAAQVAKPPTTSLCTADCSSDDDCAGSELRSAGNPAGCMAGFVCKIPETVGDFCCRSLCVCKDFLLKNAQSVYDTTKPEVCKSTPDNKANCKNIQ